MKCPDCGEEIGTGKACEKCGKDVVPSKGVEVEYKDFKISELLDIKMTGGVSSGKTMKKHGSAQEKEGGSEKAIPAEEKTSGKELLVLTSVIVILAAMAGAYLLGFLMR